MIYNISMPTMNAVSDSSEEEDLSRFREAVDVSFTKNIRGGAQENLPVVNQCMKSERYLNQASHYSDVKVPIKLQQQIGAKVAAVISRNYEFVDITATPKKMMKVKGGVKLFKDSSDYLCCDDTEDMTTKLHNQQSRKFHKCPRYKLENDKQLSITDKLNAAVIDGNYILSKAETKLWKSRRKEKIFRYKSLDNSNTYHSLV